MARTMTDRSSAGFGRLCRRMNDADQDGGFSLLESVIAFTMFMIVLVSVTSLLVTTVRETALMRDRTAAINLATQQIELMRVQNMTGQGINTGGVTTLHGVAYTVAVTASPTFTVNPACQSGSSRQVNVTVSWNGTDGPHAASYDTVLAC